MIIRKNHLTKENVLRLRTDRVKDRKLFILYIELSVLKEFTKVDFVITVMHTYLRDEVKTPCFLQSSSKLTINFMGKASILKPDRPGSNLSFTT